MEVDTTRWSGEGTFTATLVERLRQLPWLEFIRVEDASASRADANYSFISNEVYVRFQVTPETVSDRLFGFIPVRRTTRKPLQSLKTLERHLADMEEVGAPDYSDEAMLQYLKAERIVPPYQTRGYKVVELVRIYGLTS